MYFVNHELAHTLRRSLNVRRSKQKPNNIEDIDSDMFSQLLHHLSLSQIKIYPSVALLSVKNCHPVPTVIVASFGTQFDESDISNIVVDWGKTYNVETLDEYLAHGLQVRSVQVDCKWKYLKIQENFLEIGKSMAFAK